MRKIHPPLSYVTLLYDHARTLVKGCEQSILKVIRLPNILHQFFMHSYLSYFNLCTNIGLFYDQVTKTATIKHTLFLTHY